MAERIGIARTSLLYFAAPDEYSSGFFVFETDLSTLDIMTNFTEYQRTAFFGRSFEELMLCFGYRTEQLIGKRVLDCPSGPSPFVAKAHALGIQATGVDPMFYRGTNETLVIRVGPVG